MSLLDIIINETAKLGYRTDAVRRDYTYSDVWSSHTSTRSIPFVAFTQTPPSYRSAAFAAVNLEEGDPATIVGAHSALGAPLLFVIEGDTISAWQVYAKGAPRFLERTKRDDIPSYFHRHKDIWSPDVIHRAKSIGRVDPSYQLSFVDIGLIPAIEGEIHIKLDRLIREAIANMRGLDQDESARLLFRGLFRLLAAKILMDRQHPRTKAWESDNVRSILSNMGDYYKLGNNSQAWPEIAIASLAEAWKIFRSGFNVANISADDLAFIYESTLVTDKARAEFGTHSTPRHVADYIVGRLRLWEYGATPPRVYEPFTGAGVFLGSALRHMRDGLPHGWTDKERHDLLVKHIGGAEIEPFAVEVAKLSLILADYPQANGWRINEVNLFEEGALAACVEGAEVILCNPPFEVFNTDERSAYLNASEVSPSKAVFALETALRAKPSMLGFVVPNTLIMDRRYRAQRREIERTYREIELVSLPDGIFKVSQADTALLIARDRLKSGDRQLIRSAEVFDRDKRIFAQTERPSRVREEERQLASSGDGSLWLTPLQPLWAALADHPRLGTFLHGHWGLRWNDGQRHHVHTAPAPGRSLGFMNTSGLHQFVLGEPLWLDDDADLLYGGGELPWKKPKILCSAGRLGRGYWRLAAAVDRSGLVASQQFVGLWPQSNYSNVDLDALAAVINGPVVNAFLSERSFDRRFRIGVLHNTPIPENLPTELGDLSRAYSAMATARSAEPEELDSLIKKIDAIVLRSYDLPAEHEQALLSAIAGPGRPLSHQLTKRRRSRVLSARLAVGSLNPGPLFEGLDTVETSVGEGIGDEIAFEEGVRILESYAKPIALSQWAGEVLPEPRLREEFGLSETEFLQWRKDGFVVTLLGEGGQALFPSEQFVEGRPIDGLGDILRRIGSDRVAWLWLRQPHGVFDLSSPLDVLKAGRQQEVICAAARDFC